MSKPTKEIEDQLKIFLDNLQSALGITATVHFERAGEWHLYCGEDLGCKNAVESFFLNNLQLNAQGDKQQFRTTRDPRFLALNESAFNLEALKELNQSISQYAEFFSCEAKKHEYSPYEVLHLPDRTSPASYQQTAALLTRLAPDSFELLQGQDSGTFYVHFSDPSTLDSVMHFMRDTGLCRDEYFLTTSNNVVILQFDQQRIERLDSEIDASIANQKRIEAHQEKLAIATPKAIQIVDKLNELIQLHSESGHQFQVTNPSKDLYLTGRFEFSLPKSRKFNDKTH